MTSVALAMLAAALPLSAAYASGDDSSTAADSAVTATQRQLDALDIQADKAVEAYDKGQLALRAALATVTTTRNREEQAQRRLKTQRIELGALAASQYENGSAGMSAASALLQDPNDLFTKADLLRYVDNHHLATLNRVIAAQRALEEATASARQSVAAQQKAAAALASQKATVEKTIEKQQKLLASLQAKDTQQQAAALARQRSEQPTTRSRARTANPPQTPAGPNPPQAIAGTSAGTGPTSVGTTPSPATSGRVAAVLVYARAQLGKPYRWGGAGPNSFDCSGLTMRAWHAGGVSLSHLASAQQHEGRPVPLSALQPGDLVFWGNPAYHVALYAGDGKVVNAPRTGDVVKIEAIWGTPSGAVRP